MEYPVNKGAGKGVEFKGLTTMYLFIWLVFRMNARYGEHGLMKRLAQKRHPRYLIHRKRLFRLLTKRRKP